MTQQWKVHQERDKEDPKIHSYTITLNDEYGGWNTDSGYNGYGLQKEIAQYICDILNKDIENCPCEMDESGSWIYKNTVSLNDKREKMDSKTKLYIDTELDRRFKLISYVSENNWIALRDDVEKLKNVVEDCVAKEDFIVHNQRVLNLQLEVAKLSIPMSASSTHTACLQPQNQGESLTQLLQASEKHLPHDSKNHDEACHHKPYTFHCNSSGNSPSTLNPWRNALHQTNNEKGSYELLLSQIRERVLAQPGNSGLNVLLSRAWFSLLSIPELVCHVEQRGDRIHILFHDGNHPEHAHSELILHRYFHSS